MALIFRSLFKLARAARRLDKADLKSAAAVASEGEVSTSTSAGAGNHNVRSALSFFVFLLNVNRPMVDPAPNAPPEIGHPTAVGRHRR